MVANHNKRKNSGTVIWCYYELQPSILLAIVLQIIRISLVCFIIFRFFFLYFCFAHQFSMFPCLYCTDHLLLNCTCSDWTPLKIKKNQMWVWLILSLFPVTVTKVGNWDIRFFVAFSNQRASLAAPVTAFNIGGCCTYHQWSTGPLQVGTATTRQTSIYQHLTSCVRVTWQVT